MRYRFYIPQFDRPVGKKTKRPLGISLGRISAGESYDMSLDVSGNLGLYWRCLPFLSLNGCVESLLPITSPDVLDCSGRRVEGYSSLLHSHRLFPIPVHRKKDVGSQDGSRRHIAGLHNLGQLFALLCRQAHLVLLNRHNRIVLYVIQQRYNYFWFYAIFRCYKTIDQLVQIAEVGCRVERLAESFERRLRASRSGFFGGKNQEISVFYEFYMFLSVTFR